MPEGKGTYGSKAGRPKKTHVMPDGSVMKGAKHKGKKKSMLKK